MNELYTDHCGANGCVLRFPEELLAERFHGSLMRQRRQDDEAVCANLTEK